MQAGWHEASEHGASVEEKAECQALSSACIRYLCTLTLIASAQCRDLKACKALEASPSLGYRSALYLRLYQTSELSHCDLLCAGNVGEHRLTRSWVARSATVGRLQYVDYDY